MGGPVGHEVVVGSICLLPPTAIAHRHGPSQQH